MRELRFRRGRRSTRSATSIGVYHGSDKGSPHKRPRLLTGSHYDTVRDGGKYDGRLGILVPLACVARAARAPDERLPFGVEVVGFAEEEGQRYKATFPRFQCA